MIKWCKLAGLAVENFNDLPSNPGIYFVRWSKNSEPVSIPRLADIDNKGILYIGSASNLRRRVRQLWKGINGKVEDHTIGKTIIFCKISEIIDLSEFEISWEELTTRENAEGQEWTAFKLYADRYKEPPPLNLMIRREIFAVFGIAKFGRSRWAYEPDEFVKSIVSS